MIVAADLEGTLTEGAIWKGIGHYLNRHGRSRAYRSFVLQRVPEAMMVKFNLRDKTSVRERWVMEMPDLMAGYSEATLHEMAQWTVEHVLWPQRRHHLLAELAAHRRNGCRVLLVSGGYQQVVQAFAERIDAEAIGTDLKAQLDSRTVSVAQPVNTGPEKVNRLLRVLAGESLWTAYGDSLADLPMLELSQQPVAVCPDRHLHRVAHTNGWRIIER